MKLEWKDAALRGEVTRAFRDSMMVLDRNITEALTDPRWAWPTSPSPRDIVDTGQLRSSQQPPVFIAPLVAEFTNSAEYALAVHEGATFKAGETWAVGSYTRKTKARATVSIKTKRKTTARGMTTVRAHTRTRKVGYTTPARRWMRDTVDAFDLTAVMAQFLGAGP